MIGKRVRHQSTFVGTRGNRDDTASTRYASFLFQCAGYHTRSTLAVPIRDQDGAIVGVLQAINKLSPETGEPDGAFDKVCRLMRPILLLFV